MTLVRTPDKPSEPGHRGTRNSMFVIAGSGDNCNRHQSRDVAPPPPVVKLQQIVRPHDPDEADFGIAHHELLQRFCGVDGAKLRLDGGNFNRRAPRLRFGRRHPRRQRRHVCFGFQRVARRDHPPIFVKLERIDREQANRPMSAMRRVERSAHEANGFQGRDSFQGRVWPCPRTIHL